MDAGSTPRPTKPRWAGRDHPRGCGEHTSRISLDRHHAGSSPRMRGALPQIYQIHKPCRDHPRGCGERMSIAYWFQLSVGSSPRMRGALDFSGGGHLSTEIIPADAGSTAPRSGWQISETDHPRGCGEHFIAFLLPIAKRGSSPRMRGAHVYRILVSAVRRIIPADAGSTIYVNNKLYTVEDHPRGCGEHDTGIRAYRSAGGSSPRMRGAPNAGTWHRRSGRDHPRGCGEHPR